MTPRNQSLNDTLYAEAKALGGGGIPFQSGGGAGGLVPIYSSWDSWDAAMDLRYGGASSKVINYQSKIGDLAQNSLIVAAIRWLSNVLPEAPLQVKKSKGPKGPDDDEVVWDHELTNLWEHPNEFYSGSTLKKAIAFSWVLRSEAYIIKFMNNAGTEPFELWWEPHWTIRPVWPINGSAFISHYEVNREGVWYPLPVENVIHLRDGLNPYNQRFGFNGIPSVLPELYADSEAAAFYAQLMGGNAVPSFMVSLDSNMKVDQKQLDEMTRDVISRTSGKKRGQPLVLKGGKAYKLSHTPKDLDLRESRYAAEDRFCAVMGIPAVVLELGTGQAHSIYNNVAQAEARAWNQYVKPLLTHIEEEFNVQLLPGWKRPDLALTYCKHDYSQVQSLQEDQDKKAKRVGKLYNDGIIMRSEARAMMNLGPSEENNEKIDKVWGKLPEDPNTPKLTNPRKVVTEDEEPETARTNES